MINTIITYVNAFLNWVVSLFFIPSLIHPPIEQKIWFWHKHGYFFEGYYNGKYVGHWVSSRNRSRYSPEDIIAWGFLELINIPCVGRNFQLLLETLSFNSHKTSYVRPTGIQIMAGRKSREVWDYVTPLGKKIHVTYDQKKNLEKNPFYTSVKSKRDMIRKQEEKRIERENKEHYELTGKYLYD